MQTSAFKLPISPIVSGQNIIDELDEFNRFENRFLLTHSDSIDFTELQQKHPLHIMWEEDIEQDRKHREPSEDTNVWNQMENSSKDTVSDDQGKENDFLGFLTFDHIDNKITNRDRMEFKLSRSFNTTTKDYASAFSRVSHISLLVENYNTDMGFVTVGNIINSLVKHMVMINEGLCHTWTYRKRECYALLDVMGCWNLYAIAPIKYVDNTRPRTYNDPPIYFLTWDENDYLYNVVLDLKTDMTLPNSATDEAPPGSTFKDLSYCKAYVNRFVDRIRREN